MSLNICLSPKIRKFLCAVAVVSCSAICGTQGVHATSSSITVTIDDNIVDLNVAPTAAGAFSKSSTSKIGVSTTNYTGYTLSIAAQAGDNPTALVNGDKSLLSIENALTEDQFKALDATGYNNMWGYLPSKLCKTVKNSETGLSTTSCESNNSFLPSPSTDGDTLDVTSTANTAVNEYEITLGARVDTTASLGSYSNVFLVDVVANKIPYTITYLDNTISNMPTDVSDSTTDTAITISSNTPTRNGYTFIGWCTVKPTNNANGTDTCGGTSVGVGGTIALDQTSSNNNFTLYAMWSGNYTISGVTYMQDFATMSAEKKSKVISSMEIGAQYQLTDNRDNIKYWVSREADGNVWMTQNLDLCVGCTGTAALTSANTDLNSYGNGIYVTDYSVSNGTITWAPKKTGTSASSASPITSDQPITITDNNNGTVTWPNSYTLPWSAEGGNRYYYAPDTNVEDTPSNTCDNKGNGTDWCKHYHVGNYYNWTEAIASSNSTNLSTQYMAAENSICPAGWRLPKGLSNATSTASTREFGQLLFAAGVTTTLTSGGANYATNGAINIRKAPLFLVRGGSLWAGALHYSAQSGRYWSSTVVSSSQAYDLDFNSSNVYSANTGNRYDGESVRCLVR